MYKSFYIFIFFLWATFSMFSQTGKRINYSKVAKQITKGHKTRYDKSKAIYRYLCANIEYDTSYKIYNADECFLYKKGVCSAYCELYKKLCEPLGIKCNIITGIGKDYNHQPGTPLNPETDSHAWLLVEGNKKGDYYFVDPTWGAGTIRNGVFKRKENDMSWFHVPPEWTIFTHFPEDAAYQFLTAPLSYEEFIDLPALYPRLQSQELDGKVLLTAFRTGKLSGLPDIYTEDYLGIINVPLRKELQIGKKYSFTFKGKEDREYVLIHNKDFYPDFQVDGIVYSRDFTPYEPGTVRISIKKDDRYWPILSYTVPEPTPEEMVELIRVDPYYSPEIRNLPGFSNNIPYIGFDGDKVLSAVREGEEITFPHIYISDDFPLRVVDVPLNSELKIGNKYRFAVSIPNEFDIALIHNSGFYREWKNEEGTKIITFTPKEEGDLRIGMALKNDRNYIPIITYSVK